MKQELESHSGNQLEAQEATETQEATDLVKVEIATFGTAPELGTIRKRLHQAVDGICDACEKRASNLTYQEFEQALTKAMAVLGQLFILFFLTARHKALDLAPFVAGGDFRIKDWLANRTLNTIYGPVVYWRAYLLQKDGGGGFFPLDVALGLTYDGFSPGVMLQVTRLACRMSFASSVLIFRYFFGWAPSTETIESWVLGLGRYVEEFTEMAPPPSGDGEVLVIEVDGKATPTATDKELNKRRGKRKKRGDCSKKGGCNRHRGRDRRSKNKRKKKKKGDKSKNGRSTTIVVMYTLSRGSDGRLHGPINKRVWASYAPRKYAFAWARKQATKRGFPPGSDKEVQVVMDGELCLRTGMGDLFEGAIFTLDIRHLEEKIWDVGKMLFPNERKELENWVEEKIALLYDGLAPAVIEELKRHHRKAVAQKERDEALCEELKDFIKYMEKRLEMMRYDEWIDQDLVIASGVVEGAARHVVGERMDCGGMRWIPGRGEALLRLRCLEINGEWEEFSRWVDQKNCSRLRRGEKVQIRTNEPITLPKSA